MREAQDYSWMIHQEVTLCLFSFIFSGVRIFFFREEFGSGLKVVKGSIVCHLWKIKVIHHLLCAQFYIEYLFV